MSRILLPPPSQVNRIKLHLLSVLACFECASAAFCNQIDRDSLLSFADGISSSPPLNWSVSVDCCLWEGVVCNRQHRVSHLWLPSRRLGGEISPSVANLSHLSQLNLSHNQLSGPVPDRFFASWNRLQIIDLSYNGLNDHFSPSDKLPRSVQSVNISSNGFNGTFQFSLLEEARSLVSFNASNNSFTGSVPGFICHGSPLLAFLDFSFNDFVGRIPSGFGECLNLVTLRASFNALSGPLPDDIYNITTLQDLSLAANRISGPIDERVANLSELRTLSLYGNELIGTIPADIGRLSKLEKLLLHINWLNGTIPLSLQNCSRLTILNLRVNLLEGELSNFDFSALVRLRTVDLGDNFFTGGLPVSLFSCELLANIRLANNRLEGEISPDIQALQFLSFLSLSRNNFTNISSAIRFLMGCRNLSALILSKNFYGELLPEDGSTVGYDGFQELRVLALGGCEFRSHQLPAWLTKLRKLEVLDISFNRITGSIPGRIADLSSLFYLDLSYNLFSGNLPAELFRLQRLTSDRSILDGNQSYLELPIFVSPSNVSSYQYNLFSYLPGALYLDSNDFNGHLPTDIGLLKYLHVLSLSKNSFSGRIPESISNITTLEKLDLSGNSFSGHIPGSLKSLHFLSSFSIADNDLEGPVPTGGQFDTFPVSSFEGNPRLCGRILRRPCSDGSLPSDELPTAQNKIAEEEETVNWTVFGFSLGTSFFISIYLFRSFSTTLARSIVSCFSH